MNMILGFFGPSSLILILIISVLVYFVYIKITNNKSIKNDLDNAKEKVVRSEIEVQSGQRGYKPVSMFGNIIWFLFGGFFIALEYLIASVLLFATFVGIPFALQTLKMMELSLFPFGKKVVEKKSNLGCLHLIMNAIWIIIGGFWICISHILLGILFCISVIGIPFGIQHFKLAKLALTPFGKEIRG
jgi:uncharacterized membrane protein YccF (DUF307 family)